MEAVKPATRPDNPRFSSGPCAKFPQYSVSQLDAAWLGRSHRDAVGKPNYIPQSQKPERC